jgi:Ni2+-binding GTPase involved in maturation of urease and hydrogenase
MTTFDESLAKIAEKDAPLADRIKDLREEIPDLELLQTDSGGYVLFAVGAEARALVTDFAVFGDGQSMIAVVPMVKKGDLVVVLNKRTTLAPTFQHAFGLLQEKRPELYKQIVSVLLAEWEALNPLAAQVGVQTSTTLQ